MPPTTSTPSAIARFRLSKAPAQNPVLRKGNQLQVEVRRDAPLDLEQRFDGQQARIAHVDMAANRQQTARHRPVAVLQRALDQSLLGQLRFQFAPQRNAFEQRAGRIDARQTVGQRRVHMKMRVDEGRRDERTGGVDFFGGARRKMRFDRDDAPRLDADIDRLSIFGGTTRQAGTADDQVHVSLL
jgi:hypothetical protein